MPQDCLPSLMIKFEEGYCLSQNEDFHCHIFTCFLCYIVLGLFQENGVIVTNILLDISKA